MTESFIVLLWWSLFGGSHIALSSSRLRPQLVARLGERPFQGLYSLVAFATLVPLFGYYFRHKHAGPQLWRTFGPYLLARDLNLIFMALAFVLLISGLVSRPPTPTQNWMPSKPFESKARPAYCARSLTPYGKLKLPCGPVLSGRVYVPSPLPGEWLSW